MKGYVVLGGKTPELGQTYVFEEGYNHEMGHASEAPLDLFLDCDVAASRFAEAICEPFRKMDNYPLRHCCRSITPVRELSAIEIIDAQFDWTAENEWRAETLPLAASFGGDDAVSAHCLERIYHPEGRCVAATYGYSAAAAAAGIMCAAISIGSKCMAVAAGESGAATVIGEFGMASVSGRYGRASCGIRGFASVAGERGMVKGGRGSCLTLGYEVSGAVIGLATAVVGEGGIKPDTWYSCDKQGRFVEE